MLRLCSWCQMVSLCLFWEQKYRMYLENVKTCPTLEIHIFQVLWFSDPSPFSKNVVLLTVKGRCIIASCKCMVSWECSRLSCLWFFKDFSNVRYIYISPIISLSAVHNDPYHGSKLWPLLSNGTYKDHQHICVRRPDDDVACCNLGNMEGDESVSFFVIPLEVCWFRNRYCLLLLIRNKPKALATMRSNWGFPTKYTPVTVFAPLL